MALNLKQKKKCHIVAPEWLTVGASRARLAVIASKFNLRVEFLQQRILQETTQAEFTKLPFRFAEISRVLLDVCVRRIPFP